MRARTTNTQPPINQNESATVTNRNAFFFLFAMNEWFLFPFQRGVTIISNEETTNTNQNEIVHKCELQWVNGWYYFDVISRSVGLLLFVILTCHCDLFETRMRKIELLRGANKIEAELNLLLAMEFMPKMCLALTREKKEIMQQRTALALVGSRAKIFHVHRCTSVRAKYSIWYATWIRFLFC